jgi:hypothetical protein
VAANERGVTSIAYRLLRGYLLRSVWLYALLGTAQYLLTGWYWVHGITRVTMPLALLGMWGVAAALNAYSLVWRSLPLGARDASVFRWWAMAGAPGIFFTVIELISWAAQPNLAGVPQATWYLLLESLLVGWASIGLIAALPALGGRVRNRFSGHTAIALATAYFLWLVYGLPTYAAAPAISTAFTAVGLGSLVYSAARAAHGKLWRWPDVSIRSAKTQRRPAMWMGIPRFGVNAILMPLLKRTAGFALLATAGIVFLYRVLPGAGAWIFWGYFIAISSTGFLLTYPIRSALQTLRVLPLSTRQLAGMLQLYGALPGFATLALTLLVNLTLLHVKFDPLEFATFALIIIGSQVLPIAPAASHSRARGIFFRKWMPLIQRIYFPLYMGVIVLNNSGAFSRWWWFKWPLIGAGLVLCFVGYFTLVHQLRSGMRPSSNETVFSAP